MLVSDAQREVRLTFMGGFPGSVVSGTIWLVSAALGTWGSTRNATFVLLVAAMIGGGTWIGITLSGPFSFGGWFGGASILAYGVLGLILTGREARRAAPAAT